MVIPTPTINFEIRAGEYSRSAYLSSYFWVILPRIRLNHTFVCLSAAQLRLPSLTVGLLTRGAWWEIFQGIKPNSLPN